MAKIANRTGSVNLLFSGGIRATLGEVKLFARLFPPAVVALFLCIGSPFAIGRARPEPALDNPVFQALPLERSRQNHLILRAEINGKRALLGVDSGAPVSAVSLSRRDYYRMSPLPDSSKLPSRLKINGGYNRVTIAHRLRLGALTLIDEPMVAVDLSSPARVARELHEQELDGILGADILFPTQSVLDCDAQVLFMKIDPDAPGTVPGVSRSTRAGWKTIPIRVTKGWNLYVDGELNGKPAQLMIDTGAFTTLIHRPFVREMRLPLRNTPYTSGAVNLDQRGLQLATIRRFAIGPFMVKGKEVGVMDLKGLIHGDLLQGKPPVAGLLGSEFLHRNHAIIDFGTRTLYLKL